MRKGNKENQLKSVEKENSSETTQNSISRVSVPATVRLEPSVVEIIIN